MGMWVKSERLWAREGRRGEEGWLVMLRVGRGGRY
jgi:hypothetical protein